MSRNSAILIAFLGVVAVASSASTRAPTPTPDPNFQCPDKGDSFQPHPTDCTLFYQCTNGLAWLQRCDGGLFFNPATGQCDWPDNVECKAKPTSVLRQVRGQECLESSNHTCTDNGAFPHEELCEYYYDCWEGDATLCVCTEGYLFDLTYMGCNFPQYVDCGDRIRPGTGPTPPPRDTTTKGTGPTEQPPPGGDFECPSLEGLFPNPEDCSTYYQCAGGYPFLENCPPGLVFNPRSEVCDYPENVPECDGSATRPPTTTTTTTLAPPPSNQTTVQPPATSPGGFVCPKEDGFFANPEDCHSFYVCFNEEALLVPCPNGLAFNPDTNTCDLPESVPSCEPVGTNPPPPVTRPTQPPGGFVCPKDDGLYANPDDCFTYYACVAGEAIIEACPDGLAFSPVLEACDYAENVPGCTSK